MPFSKEIRNNQIEVQQGKCAILGIEVDVLEGHHCMPQCRGGSNNKHNCREVAGFNAYSVYGIPVEDVHEELDRLAIDKGLYLHPDTKELVTRDKMPLDCFRNSNLAQMPEVRKVKEKKHHKKKNKHK